MSKGFGRRNTWNQAVDYLYLEPAPDLPYTLHLRGADVNGMYNTGKNQALQAFWDQQALVSGLLQMGFSWEGCSVYEYLGAQKVDMHSGSNQIVTRNERTSITG